jgi:hypothetical protein
MTNSRQIILALLFLILGTGLGFFLSVKLFAVDIDIMAVPYVNKSVVLKNDMVVEGKAAKLTIPKGSEMLLVRRLPGGNEYSLPILVKWDDETNITRSVSGKYPYWFVEAPLKR